MEALPTQPEPPAPTQLTECTVIVDRPPNFDIIAAAFPGAYNPGVIFAYGKEVYNPSNEDIPDSLIAHELVHCSRQIDMGIGEWWDRYINDGEFRYNEELLAHIAEWEHVKHDPNLNRNERRSVFKQIAKRLSGPLYGKTVTLEKAKRDIKNG